ncbi:hypothetical protein GS489_01260 [Rhodococcus hoagii]|nr:hypothetical protein [Prescottella equi]
MTTPTPTDDVSAALRAVRTTADLAALHTARAPQNGDHALADSPAEEMAVRALVGASALLPYMTEGGASDDFESAFADLVGDLRHLAAALDVDWEAVDRRSAYYQREESGEAI